MNKLSLLMLVIIMLTSCSYPYSFNVQGYDILNEDLDSVWLKTASYKFIPRSVLLPVKSPVVFERDGGGNCSDFAVYMMYHLGKESSFISIRVGLNEVHSIVKYNGEYLEPQVYGMTYEEKGVTVLKTVGYNLMMFKTTGGGIRGFTELE
jgi:hypothetical protein